MRFVATGRYGPLPARVVWEEGVIASASPDDLRFEVEAVVRSGIRVGHAGFAYGEVALADPALAAATLAGVIDDFRVVEADEFPDQLPPGAVGTAVRPQSSYEPLRTRVASPGRALGAGARIAPSALRSAHIAS